MLLLVHGALLSWAAYRDSPVWDEVGHFAAGLSHWSYGTFNLYRVNPPLVRATACAPVALWMNYTADFDGRNYIENAGSRIEFQIGSQISTANGERYFWLMTVARFMCIPFGLLGGWVCYLWAGELYGWASGVAALTFWVFSPTVLAYGHLIVPDVAAAALGIAACYLLWRWMKKPTAMRTIATGLVLGLAELTKSTWIVLFAVWPILWICHRLLQPAVIRSSHWAGEVFQLATIMVIAIWVMNLGYGFEHSFKPLREYRFTSSLFGGLYTEQSGGDASPHNRFAESWLGHLPVPFPENYLLGIDRQRLDFEDRLWSFLRGEWRLGGWWYYYLYALLIKEPLGTWILLLLAMGATLLFRGGYSLRAGDELVLLLPPFVVLVLVSSQTGFNHHVRYVLPIYPFLFIWISRIARCFQLRQHAIGALVILCSTWAVISSLTIFPHSLSYFNELVGGPKKGHFHLATSNTDWGQDLLHLKRWLDLHPETRPLHLAYDLPLIDPKLAGIQHMPIPRGTPPDAGWYAISVNQIHHRDGQFLYFLDLQPVGMAGYSIYIYHIIPEQADHLRLRYEAARQRGGPL